VDRDRDQYLKRHRMLADAITDDMLIKPVSEMNSAEIALLATAFDGPFGQELIERLDRLAEP